MVKSLRKTVSASLFFAMVLFGGYSCSTDDYLRENEVRRMIEEALRENNKQLEFTKWEVINYTILEEDWEWIPDNPSQAESSGSYRFIADLSELTPFIYESGAVLGYVFIGEQGVDEVQKTLPYLESYNVTDENGNKIGTYTETISYDIQYAPNGGSTVAFFIQNSDRVRADGYLFDYNFRIVLVW